MSQQIVTQIIEQVNRLPEELQQQVLDFVSNLQHEPMPESGDAWNVLEAMIGTVEAPPDWSAEHDHYLYGTPKHQETEPL